MSMSTKDFIALADAIRSYNRYAASDNRPRFGIEHLDCLADFCRSQNSNFMRGRWMDYIDGECGPNGGAIKNGGTK